MICIVFRLFIFWIPQYRFIGSLSSTSTWLLEVVFSIISNWSFTLLYSFNIIHLSLLCGQSYWYLLGLLGNNRLMVVDEVTEGDSCYVGDGFIRWCVSFMPGGRPLYFSNCQLLIKDSKLIFLSLCIFYLISSNV